MSDKDFFGTLGVDGHIRVGNGSSIVRIEPVAGGGNLALNGTTLSGSHSGVFYKSGNYFPLNQTASLSTGAVPNNTLRLGPVEIPETISIVRVVADVSGAGDAGSTGIIGIYADITSGGHYPGALLFDSSVSGSASTVLANGKIAGDSASIQEITCAVTLTPGLYWMGICAQGAPSVVPTYRTLGTAPFEVAMGTTLPSANTTALGFSQSSVSGALPATFTSTVTSTPQVARLLAKAA